MSVVAGKSFLIAEDEPLIAILLEHTLLEEGASACDRAATLQDTQSLLEERDYDVAILDINLGKDISFGAAEMALKKGVCVLLTTGYWDGPVPDAMLTVPSIAKPYLIEDIISKIGEVLQRAQWSAT